MSKELVARITDYLSGGGLFNPEYAIHQAVSDLLIECREQLLTVEPDAKRYENIRNRFALQNKSAAQSDEVQWKRIYDSIVDQQIKDDAAARTS